MCIYIYITICVTIVIIIMLIMFIIIIISSSIIRSSRPKLLHDSPAKRPKRQTESLTSRTPDQPTT